MSLRADGSQLYASVPPNKCYSRFRYTFSRYVSFCFYKVITSITIYHYYHYHCHYHCHYYCYYYCYFLGPNGGRRSHGSARPCWPRGSRGTVRHCGTAGTGWWIGKLLRAMSRQADREAFLQYTLSVHEETMMVPATMRIKTNHSAKLYYFFSVKNSNDHPCGENVYICSKLVHDKNQFKNTISF